MGLRTHLLLGLCTEQFDISPRTPAAHSCRDRASQGATGHNTLSCCVLVDLNVFVPLVFLNAVIVKTSIDVKFETSTVNYRGSSVGPSALR